MSNKVEDFLNEVELKTERSKEKLLIKLGLMERVYSQTNQWTKDFPKRDTAGRYY